LCIYAVKSFQPFKPAYSNSTFKSSTSHFQTGNFHVSRILETSKGSSIVAPAKEGLDLVMVTEERYEKLRASILKDESEIAVAPTLEKLVA
jgi:hypothetical protein